MMSEETPKSRLAERDELLMKFGMLIRPISDLLDGSLPGTAIRHVRARFRAEYPAFMQDVIQVCRPSEQLRYDQELNAIKRKAWQLDEVMQELVSGQLPESLTGTFDEIVAVTSDLIREIPADDPSSILPPASPFRAYKIIRALCAGARARLELFDPWADGDTLIRYLSEVSPTVTVRLLTTSKALRGGQGVQGMRLSSISALLQVERGDLYALLINETLHDRHLRVDDEVFHLGGSVKDAGRRSPYTITKMEVDASMAAELDKLVADALSPGGAEEL